MALGARITRAIVTVLVPPSSRPPVPLPRQQQQQQQQQRRRPPPRQWRCASSPIDGAPTAAAPAAADAAAAIEAKLDAFEAALGGLSREAVLHLLSRAPPAVCSFSGETLELTLASLCQALGLDRASVVSLVRLAPGVLLAPHEPVAVLRRLVGLLRLPQAVVAANLRTRLQVLALTEAELRARCAALGTLLECGHDDSSSSSSYSYNSSSSSLTGAADTADDEAAEAAFASFAAAYPGQAIALLPHPAGAVAERLALAEAALDGPPRSAVAALARARPLVLELSPIVLRSRAAVLAGAAFAGGDDGAGTTTSGSSSGSGGSSSSSSGDADRRDSNSSSNSSSSSISSSNSCSISSSNSSSIEREQDGATAAAAATPLPSPLPPPPLLPRLLARLDATELEGLADRLLLAPHSLDLWLRQLRALLPARAPFELVRLLLRLRARPPDVNVRWQALESAARGSPEWLGELECLSVEELAELLSTADHEALARARYLSATNRRAGVRLLDAVRMRRPEFSRQYPGFMDWVSCGG